MKSCEFIFKWRIIALQCYIGFCHTSTQISHRYMYVPSLLNLPSTLHPIPSLWMWKSLSCVWLSGTLCSLPGSSIHGTLQARILEWIAFSFSGGSSQPRDQTQVSCIAGWFSTIWATRKFFIIYKIFAFNLSLLLFLKIDSCLIKYSYFLNNCKFSKARILPTLKLLHLDFLK